MRLKDPRFMDATYWTEAFKNRYGGDGCRELRVSGDAARARDDSAMVTFAVTNDPKGRIIIQPHGTLNVTHSGDNDIDWRERNEARYGVWIRLAKDLAGMLQCPHTGRKIPVSRIADNPVLWVDLEHKVAIKAGNVGYDTPDGKPYKTEAETRYCKHAVAYSFDNPKRFKAFEKRWKVLWAEAKLRVSVMVVEPMAYPSMSVMWDIFLRDDVTTVAEALAVSLETHVKNVDEVIRMWQFCKCIADFDITKEHYRDTAKRKCADSHESDYLVVVG